MKRPLLILFSLVICLSSVAQYTPTDTMSYYSDYFRGRRMLKISLPKDYASNPARRYRVIYLFDAQSSALYDFTKATLAFFPGYANFYFDPVILVGVETRNRHFEFLSKHENTVPGPQNYQNAGGADTLALSIMDELKPLIEKTYRTNGFSTGIGHSLGATFVTYSMLKFPGIFNAGICISPNYVFDNEAMFSTLKNTLKKNALYGRFLYIAYGHGDETEEKFKTATAKFGKLLRESKITGFYYKVEGLSNNSHSTTPMEGIFKGLVFINDFMNLPYEKYKHFFDAGTKEDFIDYVKKYFKTQSENTKATLPSIGELNTIAYNAFYAYRKKEAIQILEWAISLYPADANLYDSMGEIQESAGDIEKAKQYYLRGLSVVERQKEEMPEYSYKSKISWFKQRLEKAGKKQP